MLKIDKIKDAKRSDVLAVVLLLMLIWSFIQLNFYKGLPAWFAMQNKDYIAIVIEDLGNNEIGTKEILSLDIPMTVGVIPFRNHSAKEAELAHKQNKEVIIHMPMESESLPLSALGPKCISIKHNQQEIDRIITEAMEELVYATGMSNHTGSRVTANKNSMNGILQVLKQKDLFFLDNVNTSKTAVPQAAEMVGSKTLRRHIFIDNVKTLESTKKALAQATKLAKKNGYAIVVGHVGEEGGLITAEAIREMIPRLQVEGIEFVTLSQLLKLQK